MRVISHTLSFGIDLSQAQTSSAFAVDQGFAAAIQIGYTATNLSGTFKLQASLDEGNPNAASEAARASLVANWTDIATGGATIPSATINGVSGNSTVLLRLDTLPYTFIRVVWTPTAGTGTATSIQAVEKAE